MSACDPAARHEAAHAVVAYMLGNRRVRRIVLNGDGTKVTTIWTRRTEHDPCREAIVCLAGPLGEMLVTGSTSLAGQTIDLDRVVEHLRGTGISFDEVFDATLALIERYRDLIEWVAFALVACGGVLDEAGFLRIIARPLGLRQDRQEEPAVCVCPEAFDAALRDTRHVPAHPRSSPRRYPPKIWQAIDHR
jgi:hypothetical protein